ncbi:MAG: RNA polymerase sigma factor [bacterium]|nr:RNA polymerase sigma factor [bacterium]
MIEQAKQRDEEAFLALIQRDMPVIRAVIAKYIQRITAYEEEDILKIVVLYAWEKISDLRGGEEAFKSWLGQKTHWICLDLLKKQKKEGNPIPLDSLGAYERISPQNPGPNILEIILTEERNTLFQDALDALPEVYKNAVSLRYRGLSYAQIAEILDIDIKTVGSRLHRGIQIIKHILEKRGVF